MKTIESIVVSVVIGALAAALGACDGQATPDYQGMPLAVLQGTISTDATTVMPPDLRAGLSWVKPIPSEGSLNANQCGGELVVARPGPVPVEAAVKGAFPARFTLDIFTPPPADMMEKDGLARAAVVVFEKATGKVWGTTVPASQLVYVAPGFAGSRAATPTDYCIGWTAADHWERNPHSSGYYLLEKTKDCLFPTMAAPGPGVNIKQLQEAPQGLATELTIEVKTPPEPVRTGPCPVNTTGP